MSDRLTIPEVFHDFAAYHKRKPVWGVLHIVLEEGNVGDGNVEGTIKWAREEGDAEGERLARLLLRMTKTQRSKLDGLVHDFERGSWKPKWPAPRSKPVDDRHAAFLADIIAAPDDDTPRLIYADWLEDPDHNPGPLQPEWAEFIRVQCWLASHPSCGSCTGPEWQRGKPCRECDQREAYRRRQRELSNFAAQWPLLTGIQFIDVTWVFTRGFIEAIACTAGDVVSQLDAIQLRTPLRHVKITPPLESIGVFRSPVSYDLDEDVFRIARWAGLTFDLPPLYGPSPLQGDYSGFVNERVNRRLPR